MRFLSSSIFSRGTACAVFSVAVLLFVAAPTASADILILNDGTVYPDIEEFDEQLRKNLASGIVPGADMLAFTRDHKVRLNYGEVSMGRVTVSAAAVKTWYSSEADQNAAFQDGETAGAAGSFGAAAAKFLQAADDLKGSAKELAMWKCLSAHWAAADGANIKAAAAALIAEFPKSFYFAKAMTYTALVELTTGNASAAKAAFDKIINAPGMNAAHMFQAELDKVEYFQFKQAGSDPAKYKQAEEAYASIRRQIQAHPKRADASVQLKLAQVGVGKSLVFQNKLDEAIRTLQEVVSDNSVTDRALLSAAYQGLGNAIYSKAKAAEAEAETDAAKAEALAMFKAAESPYLRVVLLYGDDYPQEATDCTMNLARVYANQFVLTGEKDEVLGNRAMNFYIRAYHRLDRGDSRRRSFGTEAQGFQEQLKAAFPEEEGEGGN